MVYDSGPGHHPGFCPATKPVESGSVRAQETLSTKSSALQYFQHGVIPFVENRDLCHAGIIAMLQRLVVWLKESTYLYPRQGYIEL